MKGLAFWWPGSKVTSQLAAGPNKDTQDFSEYGRVVVPGKEAGAPPAGCFTPEEPRSDGPRRRGMDRAVPTVC